MNNFDQSSSDVNLNLSCFYDLDLSRHGLMGLGGDLYMGFIYDSYETPLRDTSFNSSSVVYSWVDDDDPTLVRVEGYFCINGLMYHL